MKKRYKGAFSFSMVVTIASLILLLVIPPMLEETGTYAAEFIPLFPGPQFTDILILITIPYVFMLLMLFIGPILSYGFVIIHKIMKRNKYEYFLTSNDKELSSSRIIFRSIFPGLLAINIAIYIELSGIFGGLFAFDPSAATTVLNIALIIGIPIASLVIIPLWILDSSGLTSRKRIALYSRPMTPEIVGVSKFYLKMLKGYTGISTIITFTMILIDYLSGGSEGLAKIVVVFAAPLDVIFIFSLISVLVEMRTNNVNDKLNTLYKKLKIETNPKNITIA